MQKRAFSGILTGERSVCPKNLVREKAMSVETVDPIKATQGTYVEVELIDESSQAETLAFDLVPDEDADFDNGLLGLGTPLGRAIKGKVAGDTVAYHVGDVREVRLLKVTYSRRSLSETNATASRQAALRKAVSQSDLAEAIRFASTVNQKWGDYDPEGIAAHWEESPPDETK